MERVLCVKIASRGDLLLAAPAFRKLREDRPKAEITLLVGETCEDVARHLPYFDAIQIMNDRHLMAGTLSQKFGAAFSLFRNIRREWNEILIFHRDWRYACIAWAAGVPIRRGFHSLLGNSFLTHSHNAGEQDHHTDQYLAMAGYPTSSRDSPQSLAGVWKFRDGEREAGLKKAVAHGFSTEKMDWVALGFGGGRNVKTRTTLKTWPTVHYQRLAEQLEERGRRMVWLGDSEDATLVENLRVPGINLAGRLSISETAAVLCECRIAVSNDTLILHLSESLGVPTLGLFGPTDPSHYRPRGEHSKHLWLGVPCSPCHRDGYFPPCSYEHTCMNALDVETVLEKIEQMA